MTVPTDGARPSPPPRSDDKAEWRRWGRTLPPVGAETAARVREHLVRFLSDITDPVLMYVALPDEVDVDLVLAPGVLRADAALPRIADDGTMTVHLDDGGRERHGNGIEQPPADAREIDAAVLGAVVVPGRLFDRTGYRLGRGGGHYDRLLPHVDPAVPVIGVTCAARLLDRLPREDHDRPMTHLVTETGPFSTK